MNVIIDTGCANLLSLKSALERLGYPVVISANPELIRQATKVLLPGVGTAKHAMQNLVANGLDQVIKSLEQPVLGICLGMQLLCDRSREGRDGNIIDCLGIIPGNIDRLTADHQQSQPELVLRVPHMGWNDFSVLPQHPLFEGITARDYFYYVHSYAAEVSPWTIAQCHYNAYTDPGVNGNGVVFSAALAKDNFIGVQFHPERSGPVGSRLLKNFLEMTA